MSTIPTDNGAPYIPQGGSEKSETPTVQEKSTIARIGDYLGREIDSKQADLISIYACFLTGFTSAISFGVSGAKTLLLIRHALKSRDISVNTGHCLQSPLIITGLLYLVWISNGKRSPTGSRDCSDVQSSTVRHRWIPEARSTSIVLSAHLHHRGFIRTSWGQDRTEEEDLACVCLVLPGLVGDGWRSRCSFLGRIRHLTVSLSCCKVRDSVPVRLTRSDRDGPSWVSPLGFVALGFLSASLGLQGIIGKVRRAGSFVEAR
jgi:hypothetical protein